MESKNIVRGLKFDYIFTIDGRKYNDEYNVRYKQWDKLHPGKRVNTDYYDQYLCKVDNSEFDYEMYVFDDLNVRFVLVDSLSSGRVTEWLKRGWIKSMASYNCTSMTVCTEWGQRHLIDDMSTIFVNDIAVDVEKNEHHFNVMETLYDNVYWCNTYGRTGKYNDIN